MFKLIDKICHSHKTNAPKGMGLACDKFVDSYLTMQDRPFLTIFLKLRSKVKVTVPQKQNVTLHEPKMHPYTKHETCSGHDYSRTENRGQGHSDPKMVCIHTSNLGVLPQMPQT